MLTITILGILALFIVGIVTGVVGGAQLDEGNLGLTFFCAIVSACAFSTSGYLIAVLQFTQGG